MKIFDIYDTKTYFLQKHTDYVSPHSGVQTQDKNSEPPPTPARKNSLDLFYRKIYHMTSRRIQHLAERIDCPMNNASNAHNLVQTIFTIFENCIINHASILKDRHIDQVNEVK